MVNSLKNDVSCGKSLIFRGFPLFPLKIKYLIFRIFTFLIVFITSNQKHNKFLTSGLVSIIFIHFIKIGVNSGKPLVSGAFLF